MADIREALLALLDRPYHAPMSTHDPRDGSCQSCPWPLHEMPPEDIVDAILAEFDVTERGVHNHDIDPACPETRLPDGSLRGACAISAMTAFDSPHGMWCPPGCGHDRSEAAVPSGTGVRERVWQALRESRRTGLGGMTEAQALDHMTDAVLAAVDQRVKPSEGDVARALAELNEDTDWEGGVESYLPDARVVLALLPGRTEAEVYREGYDQGLRDAASVSRSEAEVKAEAWDEGLRAGEAFERARWQWSSGATARIVNGLVERPERPTNPYRADRIEKEADRG